MNCSGLFSSKTTSCGSVSAHYWLQVEALTKKVELCKQEVYKAEGGATKQNATLEARCLELTRRVEHYERLERELDQAVINSGTGDATASEVVADVGASGSR